MSNLVNIQLFSHRGGTVAVVIGEVKRTTISISQQTKDALDSMKHPGQSYNGLIQELIKFWQQKKGDYWTRRKRET